MPAKYEKMAERTAASQTCSIRLTESMTGDEGKDSSQTLHSTSVCTVLMSDCSCVRSTQVEAETGRNSNVTAKYWLL